MQPLPETRPSLLVRLRNPHDDEAWSQFLEIYQPVLYRLARGRGLQDADAREVTQEVLIAVSKAMDAWDPDRTRGSFRGWLRRVTRNLAVNHLIRRGRHTQPVGGSDMLRWLEIQPEQDTAESAMFDLESKRQLFRWAAEQIRDQVARPTWEAFWQTSIECRTVPEVARSLNMTAGAVYVARSRVMARLRQRIQLFLEE